jgi:hypothetical protein
VGHNCHRRRFTKVGYFKIASEIKIDPSTQAQGAPVGPTVGNIRAMQSSSKSKLIWSSKTDSFVNFSQVNDQLVNRAARFRQPLRLSFGSKWPFFRSK